MTLAQLGWNPFFEQQFARLGLDGVVPARVMAEHGQIYDLHGEHGSLLGEISGKLRHSASSRGELPAVGDWVAVQPRPGEQAGIIHRVLARKSCFARKVAGGATEEQIVAANVDLLFLVSGLDGDFSPRRIERYLAPAWESGARPVLLLNKADLCPDVDRCIAAAEAVAIGVPVLAASAASGVGMDALLRLIGPGATAAFLGSSGVGKSSLINRLLGDDRQATSPVRAHDSRGHHTTTVRQLFPLASGGLLMDTPGMRELQLWSEGDGVRETFHEVEELAASCRFTDCQHDAEPGCAVRAALDQGTLEPERYESYLKLQRELRHLEARKDQRLQAAEKQRWKKIAQLQKDLKKHRSRFGR
jgi:ribosome biogenesis GTPase